LFPSI